MIVLKNKFIPFGKYRILNLFGILITKSDISDKDKNHESIHSKQMIELGLVFSLLMLLLILVFNLSYLWLLLSLSSFYIWYGIEYLIIEVFGNKGRQNDKYHEVSLEEEAHNNDDNLDYLKVRKPFNWIKYIRIDSYTKFS